MSDLSITALISASLRLAFPLLIISTLSGCKGEAPSKPQPEVNTAPLSRAKPAVTAPKTEANSAAALTPEGKRFEPPVDPKTLPAGSYYCDMGTAHYARSERGDNTCPICKMKLTHKR